MIPPVVDETPLHLPVVEAARRSGIAPEWIEALARPARSGLDDEPPVGSTRGSTGRLLVHLPDVMIFAGALEDSGLLTKYGPGAPPHVDPVPF